MQKSHPDLCKMARGCVIVVIRKEIAIFIFRTHQIESHASCFCTTYLILRNLLNVHCEYHICRLKHLFGFSKIHQLVSETLLLFQDVF